MIRPSAGLRVFHRGKPIEFLHLLSIAAGSETWRVRPLFTATDYAPEFDEVYKDGDRLTPIHTQSR